ncbi:MAG: fibronectin type III domain-containing protein [Kiritimatiellae bacterium]|nr:fibronectin type III domain-containing protein [Kiritimatiellia bacterium]
MQKSGHILAVLTVFLLVFAISAEAATVSKPTFSKKHGFYDASFTVQISSATAGATIRYTTDGSKPTGSAGTVLANGGWVTIAKTTCLRAVACKSGMTTSAALTQTYIFLNDVLTQTKPAGFPTQWGFDRSGVPCPADYDMDSRVVNDSRYKSTMKSDLKALPTLSIVSPYDSLFGASHGIYMNALEAGDVSERDMSVELIHPSGATGFQIDGGVRIGGSGFRGATKKNFKVRLRSEYGASRLNYDLFPGSGESSFRAFQVRAAGNDNLGFAPERGQLLRDEWGRETQRDMGWLAPHGRFAHVYLNGMYWGLYNLHERVDQDWLADHYGGAPADYDIIVGLFRESPYYSAKEGSASAFAQAVTIRDKGLANSANYDQLKQYIDVTQMIDYFLVCVYEPHLDWDYYFDPHWTFNNIRVCRQSRNRSGSSINFQFIVWDIEHSMEIDSKASPDKTGGPGPWAFHQKCLANADYKALFADRIYRHFYNGGALSQAEAKARYSALAQQVDRAIVPETARWGGARLKHMTGAFQTLWQNYWSKTGGGNWDNYHPRTRDDEWIPERNRILNTFLHNRSASVVSQFRAKGLYPSLNPPGYSRYGGTVAAGFKLTLSRSAGTVYYRTDGQDPRASGGGIVAGTESQASSVVLTLNATSTVKARQKNGSTWSALAGATFTVTGSVPTPPAAPSGLAASAQSSSQIRLTWTDNSGNETGFKLERRPAGGSWAQIAQPGANTTAYTDSGLSAGQSYEFRVRASNAAGDSAYSNTAGATTPVNTPAAPSGLTATAASFSRVDLAWTDNSNNETGFKIERRLSGGDWAQLATVGANVKTYADTTVAAGTSYRYQVRAYNASGDSPYSDVAYADTPAGLPAAPSGLTASAQSSSQIRLAWLDNSGDETGFKLDRRQTGTDTWVRIATLAANATSHTDSGLPDGTTFYYKVKAYNTAGNSAESAVASATTPQALQPPAAPGNPTAAAVSASRIDVKWLDNSANEDGFKIDRRQSGLDEWVRIATLAANATSHADAGLPDATTFYYKIKAYNAAGDSAESAVASATTQQDLQPPAAPGGLTATALSATQVALQWTDNSADEEGFRIERRVSGGSWAALATVAANVPSYTDTAAQPGTAYRYQVKAYNAAGESAYSEVASVTTPAPPAAPTGLAATAASASRIALSWTDASANEDGFRLDRRQSGATDWVRLASPAADATACADTGLPAQTKFYYKVKAYNASGESAYSAIADATTAADLQPPAAPSALAATAVSPTEVALTWADNSDNEDGFSVERRVSGSAEWVPAAGPPANTTACTDAGLTPGTGYRYRVSAHNAAGRSALSETASVDTPPDTAPREWTAYHDLGWLAGQPDANITTAPAGAAPLVDFASGQPIGITLTIASPGAVSHWAESNPAAGTDAHAVFNGKLDCNGFISSTLDPITFAFSGLDPGRVYDVVLFGNRAGGYLDRLVTTTISDVDAFENASSAGAGFSGPGDRTVTICNGENTANGYVARFVNVLPGRDGTFTLSARGNGKTAYVNALMLRVCEAQARPPDDTDTDGMSDGWETAYFGSSSASDGGAEDDADGDGVENWKEYVAGTDPTGQSEYFAVALTRSGSQLVVSFPTVEATGTGYEGLTRRYALERQIPPDPAWSPIEGYTDIPGAGQTVTYTVPSSTQPALFRGRVWLAAE